MKTLALSTAIAAAILFAPVSAQAQNGDTEASTSPAESGWVDSRPSLEPRTFPAAPPIQRVLHEAGIQPPLEVSPASSEISRESAILIALGVSVVIVLGISLLLQHSF